MSGGSVCKILEKARQHHQKDFARVTPIGWEFYRRVVSHIYPKLQGLARGSYNIWPTGDVFAGMYFMFGDTVDVYEKIYELAFELYGMTVWTISGPGLKLLHGLGTAAERVRFSAAAAAGVVSVPFRPVFSVSAPFHLRSIGLTIRGSEEEIKGLDMAIDGGFMPMDALITSPFTRSSERSDGDDYHIVMDFPTYQELHAPVSASKFLMPSECKTPYCAIAVAVYLPDASWVFIPRAITAASVDGRALAPLDAAGVMFGVRGVATPALFPSSLLGDLRIAAPAEIKISFAPEVLGMRGARVRILGVRACTAMGCDGSLIVCKGSHEFGIWNYEDARLAAIY